MDCQDIFLIYSYFGGVMGALWSKVTVRVPFTPSFPFRVL